MTNEIQMDEGGGTGLVWSYQEISVNDYLKLILGQRLSWFRNDLYDIEY